MLVISNHVIDNTPLSVPDDAVIRINVAWIKDLESLKQLLQHTKHDIYLDYPQGRSKPPKPSIPLEEVLALIPQFPNIKHFAVSNVEEPLAIAKIREQLSEHVGLVPKIETKEGVDRLEEIIDSSRAKFIMLDKEDLYLAVKMDHELFDSLIQIAREKTHAKGSDILELHGVIFYPYKKKS